MPIEHTGNSKHILQTTQRRLYTWTSPDGQNQNQIDYIFFAAKDGEALYNQQNKTGDDCGTDRQLPIAKFRLKLKKTGKKQ